MKKVDPWIKRTAPCATCPYRKESKKALWAEVEFTNLRQQNANTFQGAIFNCHSDGKLHKVDPKAAGPCIGWLLDQQRHGVPSIPLRLKIATHAGAREAFKNLSDEGLDLYQSVDEMHKANYPPKTRKKKR